jgi:hypothetical protein
MLKIDKRGKIGENGWKVFHLAYGRNLAAFRNSNAAEEFLAPGIRGDYDLSTDTKIRY